MKLPSGKLAAIDLLDWTLGERQKSTALDLVSLRFEHFRSCEIIAVYVSACSK